MDTATPMLRCPNCTRMFPRRGKNKRFCTPGCQQQWWINARRVAAEIARRQAEAAA